MKLVVLAVRPASSLTSEKHGNLASSGARGARAGRRGTTIFPVARDTTYGGTSSTDPRTTSYHYTVYSSTAAIQSMIEAMPAITSSQNGSDINSTATSSGSTTTLVDTALGSGSYVGDLLTILSGTDAGQSAVVSAYNSSTHTLTFSPAFSSSTGTSSVYTLSANVMSTYYDSYGEPIWTKDADGHVNYTAYDLGTGAVTQSIVDVNYSSLTSDQQSSFGSTGWSNPSGLNLSTTYTVDALGRTTQMTSPNGNITYTVYNDANHEERVYPGFVSGATTGPIEIYRTVYPSANSSDFLYTEMITSSATPHLTSSVPDGTETISSSNIQSLERDFTNAAGQTVWVDRYVSLSGITYSQAVGADMSGNPSDLGTSGTNFYRTTYSFDEAGRPNRTLMPTGTIYRTVYDALGRVSSRWVGTNDTPTSGYWSPSNTAGTNLMDVEDDVYDSGGVGDSNLTQATFHVDTSSSDDRVSRFLYDFEDRLVAEKDGIQSSESDGTNRPITYYVIDNAGEIVRTYRYAGDGVSLTDFSTAAVTDAIPTADASDVRALTVDSYDDQGRIYRSQTFSIDQTNGTNGLSDASILALTNVATDTFYDHRGNMMAVFSPGGLATKDVYDGAGRLTTQYITDGGAVNNSNTPQKDWTDASSVSNDVVLTENDYTYDSDGNVTLTTQRLRFDNDSTSSKGALGSPSSGIGARVYYTADYYDAADRLTDDVNVGTKGGSSYTRPGSVPSRSDTVLVTHTDYDVAGNAYKITDPRTLVTQDSFDMLGRKTQEIDGASGSPATGEQLTNWTYDGDNNVLTMQAVFPGTMTPSQTTQYVYGVGTTALTDLFSNDLIAKVEYPTKSGGSAGNPSTSASDDVAYTYNLLGEVKTLTDQNGNVHTYTYDVLGRVKLDAVTTLGSGVDGSIRALGYSYTALGLPYQQTSYSNSAGTTVVNQVQEVYNGFGQLITQYQEHSGSVNTSTSLKVQYGYTTAANGSRLTSMTYPNGRVEDYVYNSGIDTNISRVSGISDDAGTGSGNVQSYTYLGLSTIVQESDGNGIELTYIKQSGESNGDAGDQYIGLDRFGRVVDQRYIPPGSPSNPTDRFQYGYDRDGNVLYKNNLVKSTFSELYHANSSTSGDNNTAYDNLNELLAFRRGTLSSSSNNGSGLDTVSTLNSNSDSSQSYTLDAVGNQTSVTTDGTNQTNTVNSQNQETAAGSNTLAFDNNGNTTTDDQGHTLVYDAWNRLIQVKNGGTTIASYVYDALGSRVSRAAGGTATDFYDSAKGQVLEERQTSSVTNQYVWGLAYVNQLVLRDDNSTSGSYGKSSSGLGRRIYVQQDANYNVTALTDTSGNILQRFVYTPYGIMTVIGSTSAWSTVTDSCSWVYTFQGGRNDSSTGMIHFGFRDYSPTLARWVQQDPAGYINGMNLYQFLGSAPANHLDPSGLFYIIWQDTEPFFNVWYWYNRWTESLKTTIKDSLHRIHNRLIEVLQQIKDLPLTACERRQMKTDLDALSQRLKEIVDGIDGNIPLVFVQGGVPDGRGAQTHFPNWYDNGFWAKINLQNRGDIAWFGIDLDDLDKALLHELTHVFERNGDMDFTGSIVDPYNVMLLMQFDLKKLDVFTNRLKAAKKCCERLAPDFDPNAESSHYA